LKKIVIAIFIILIILPFLVYAFALDSIEYDDICIEWNPFSNKILFARIFTSDDKDKEKYDGVYWVDSKSKIVKQLDFIPSNCINNITWGERENEVIYCDCERKKNLLYSINLSGYNKRLIVDIDKVISKISGNYYIININGIRLSPDGKYIALSVNRYVSTCAPCKSSNKRQNYQKEVSLVKSQSDIIVIDLKKKKARRITNCCLENTSPAWSPDMKRISFASTYYIQSDSKFRKPVLFIPIDRILIYDFKDDEIYQIGKTGTCFPSWSVHNEICFSKVINYKNNISRICKINLYTGEVKCLTNDSNSDNTFPEWSPDGKHIAFSSNRNKNSDNMRLFIMDSDGANIRQITE